MKSLTEFILESIQLNEAVGPHHKIAVAHGYRVGTKVGTSGYYHKDGGFVHVYHHPKGHELHVHSNDQGKVDQWVHASEKGETHRVGVEPGELRSHFALFHPEVKDKLEKDRQTKQKQELDKDIGAKQGKLLDKMIKSSKMPSLTVNAPAAMKPKSKAKKK